MEHAIWLPPGTPIPGGGIAADTVAKGPNWQIVTTLSKSHVLLAKPELKERWVQQGYIEETLFQPLQTARGLCCLFASRFGYLVSSIQQGPYPSQPTEAQIFAMTLKNARKKLGDEISFHDAIYIEQFSLLLPTYTQGAEDDATVLGTWLTGGVHISVHNADRISSLLGWMPHAQLSRVIKAAGIESSAPLAAQPRASLPPDARFTLPGRPDLENFFNENIVDLVLHEEQYRRMGIEFPGAIVLHGQPGCGKTFAVDKLVEFLGWPSYRIDSSSIGSSFIHDTSVRIAGLFDKAIRSAPAVVIIDEMEAFLSSRDTNRHDVNRVEEVAEFLRRIPEASKHHVLVFGMTNRLAAIDPAILRRGRFDHLIEVKMPTAAEVQMLLEYQFESLPIASDVDVRRLSHKLEYRPFSDVTFVLREAGRLAVRRRQDEIHMAALEDAYALLPDAKPEAKRRIGF